MKNIPLVKPEFPNLRAVDKIFASSWKSRQFANFGDLYERAVNKLSDVTYGKALPVTSGTTAIQVALAGLNIRGKRVALPDYTHSGTLLAVVQAGGIPVLFGVNPKTWTLNIMEVYEKSKDLGAVIVVSPFGYFLDVNPWEDFTAVTKVPVVYDFAAAFGYFPKTQNPRCYSFHATKNFSTGEGGCVVYSDWEKWDNGQRISNFGTLPDRSIQNMEGLNAKIDELKAACIVAMCDDEMLSRVWKKVQNKNALLKFYEEQTGAYVPPGPKKPSLCVLGGVPAKDLEKAGLEQGIVCKSYYPLLSKMPSLAHIARESESPVEMETCLALPSDVSWSEAYRVVELVRKAGRIHGP